MNTPAILLCGGRATRLAPLFPDTPKALVPVAGRPFLLWQLEWLATGGLRRIHLAAGHLADRLTAWLDANARRIGHSPTLWQLDPPIASAPLQLSLSIEPAPLGTGGGLRFAADSLAHSLQFDRTLVLNGDSLLPHLNVQSLDAALARASNPWTLLAVTRVPDATRFGTIRLDGTRIVAFEEKGRSGPGLINGGIYAMTLDAIRSIPADRPLSNTMPSPLGPPPAVFTPSKRRRRSTTWELPTASPNSTALSRAPTPSAISESRASPVERTFRSPPLDIAADLTTIRANRSVGSDGTGSRFGRTRAHDRR